LSSNIRNTACSFAWDYPNLSFTGNKLKNCCRGPWFRPSDADISRLGKDLFSEYEPFIEIKSALLRGERHESCAKCWETEDQGVLSPRNNLIGLARYVERTGYFPHKNAKEIEALLLDLTPQQEYEIARLRSPGLIEIALDTTCDLKCVYCNLSYSTQWASESLQHVDITPEQLQREQPRVSPAFEQLFWDWFDSYAHAQAYYITFIGGEPLIIDKYYQYMDRIIEKYKTVELQQTLSMVAVTNLNTPPRYLERFFDVVDRMIRANPNVSFCVKVSQESIGARAEFIRTGLNWSRFESNFNRLMRFKQQHPLGDRIEIDVIPSQNALSISESPKFFTWLADLSDSYGYEIGINEQQVVWPYWLNATILPPEYAAYIDQSIAVIRSRTKERKSDRYRDWTEHCKFLESLKQGILQQDKPVDQRRTFIRELNKLCDRRSLDFHHTFPEMFDFYELCRAS
jgi:hypothetical protein